MSLAASCLVPTNLASCISCHRSFQNMLVNSSIRELLRHFGLQISFCARMDLSLRARRKTGSNPTSFFQQGTGRQRANTSTLFHILCILPFSSTSFCDFASLCTLQFLTIVIESSSAMDNLQACELDCREIFSCPCFHL